MPASNHAYNPPSSFGRDLAVLLLLVIILVGVAAVRLLVGESFGWPEPEILQLRLHRLLIGLIVGGALSVGGALLQGLLRNPLASPYILGLSSGAALGVMVNAYLLWLGAYQALHLGEYLLWVSGSLDMVGIQLNEAAVHAMADPIAALLGALLTMAVVYALSQRRGWIDPLGLLLVGVIVNAINGAAIMFVNFLVPNGLRGQLALWMMGYLNENVPLVLVQIVGITALVCIFLSIVLGRSMDIAMFSDAEAHSLGLHLPRLRLILFILAGILTACVVVLAGPIGFVGLICPHLVRLMIGPRHRPLIIGSALAGAALVVGADVAIKYLDTSLQGGQGLMPIGILTAVIGGPIFLWMLRPQLGRGTDA